MERNNKTYHTIEFEREFFPPTLMATPCPYGVGDNIGVYKVGSHLCQRCIHFGWMEQHKDEIHCSFPKKENV